VRSVKREGVGEKKARVEGGEEKGAGGVGGWVEGSGAVMWRRSVEESKWRGEKKRNKAGGGLKEGDGKREAEEEESGEGEGAGE